MGDLLADAVAELYSRDPDDFTQRRQDLVAQAREAGEQDAAKKISALRKPTRSAWVVNHLVRSDPQVPHRLAELSDQLRGGAADAARLRELTSARGRLVDELTRQALASVPAPPAAPSATLREEVTSTLDAAIADPEVAANLGTLVRAAQWAGFGVAPFTGTASTPARSAKKQPATPGPDPAEAAAERDRRYRERLDEAERAVAEAGRDVESAAGAERDLEDAVRRLEAELADARQQLSDARRRSYRAESRRRRAQEQLDRIRK
jgi:hypothetical protein